MLYCLSTRLSYLAVLTNSLNFSSFSPSSRDPGRRKCFFSRMFLCLSCSVSCPPKNVSVQFLQQVHVQIQWSVDATLVHVSVWKCHLVVDVHKVSQLFGENPSSVVQWQLAAWHHNLERLLQVACSPLQKPQYKILNTRVLQYYQLTRKDKQSIQLHFMK